MRLKIDKDGVQTVVEADIEDWGLQDAVALEEVLGAKQYAKFEKSGRITPKVLRAMFYIRLLPLFPGLDISEFDFDLSALLEDEESESEGAVLELPMQVVGGEEETVTLGG